MSEKKQWQGVFLDPIREAARREQQTSATILNLCENIEFYRNKIVEMMDEIAGLKKERDELQDAFNKSVRDRNSISNHGEHLIRERDELIEENTRLLSERGEENADGHPFVAELAKVLEACGELAQLQIEFDSTGVPWFRISYAVNGVSGVTKFWRLSIDAAIGDAIANVNDRTATT